MINPTVSEMLTGEMISNWSDHRTHVLMHKKTRFQEAFDGTTYVFDRLVLIGDDSFTPFQGEYYDGLPEIVTDGVTTQEFKPRYCARVKPSSGKPATWMHLGPMIGDLINESTFPPSADGERRVQVLSVRSDTQHIKDGDTMNRIIGLVNSRVKNELGQLLMVFVPYIDWLSDSNGHPKFSPNFLKEHDELNALIDAFRDKCTLWCLVSGNAGNMFTYIDSAKNKKTAEFEECTPAYFHMAEEVCARRGGLMLPGTYLLSRGIPAAAAEYIFVVQDVNKPNPFVPHPLTTAHILANRLEHYAIFCRGLYALKMNNFQYQLGGLEQEHNDVRPMDVWSEQWTIEGLKKHEIPPPFVQYNVLSEQEERINAIARTNTS